MKEFSGMNGYEMEHLVATIEKSLEINKRFQFYLWAQGTLQTFIPHQTLLCAHGDITRMRFKYETFSSGLFDARVEQEMGHPTSGLLARMVDAWLRSGFAPQLCSPQGSSQDTHSQPVEPGRHDFGDVAAHGPREIKGEFGSFFVFVRLARRPGAREAYLLELLMPYMHMALYRMLSNESSAKSGEPASKGLLSPREIQVLRCVKNGKTNKEIGKILEISPATAKNHMQKILRKLSVNNRAQAVGKSVALRLLPPGDSG